VTSRPPGVSLDAISEPARTAWLRLRDALREIVGDDLVAVWAHGGTTFTSDPAHSGDLDTYVIVGRTGEGYAQRTADAQYAIAQELGVEWDTWYVLADDAKRPEAPHHAFRPERRDTAWAVNRAHWLAGRYVLLHGAQPAEVVPAPTWAELEADMSRELEHIERHILEGDTDPYEATYAVFNGSRILHSLETRDVAISKRAAGAWALEHLPDRWHPALRAGMRSYAGEATADDEALLAAEMAPFVAMVRERLPYTTDPTSEPRPRWSGF
jgi:hypothetical protein